MQGEGSETVMVLPVHIIGNRAADRYETGPRCNGDEPAGRHGNLQDVGKQHPRFAGQHASLTVEPDETVEPARVHEPGAYIQAAIAIASPVAVRQDRVDSIDSRKGIAPAVQTDGRMFSADDVTPGTHGFTQHAQMMAKSEG